MRSGPASPTISDLHLYAGDRRIYLGEKAILKNVPTWRCREPEALRHVLANLGDLVVKEVNGSGGYGMLVGPRATKAQIEAFAVKLAKDPDNFIAQPTLALSTAPTFFDSGIAPRHVDLRPFVLTGTNGVRVVPGGLTRVALIENSLVVNSSQGGAPRTPGSWTIRLSIPPPVPEPKPESNPEPAVLTFRAAANALFAFPRSRSQAPILSAISEISASAKEPAARRTRKSRPKLNPSED